MRRAKIIIGANYGDEGKGLAAAWCTGRLEGRKLNILINGGAQRGHTVDRKDGCRHVFHHFGSGCPEGADSCADRDFIVNPMTYVSEKEKIERTFGLKPRLYIAGQCRVTTPFDMILGQIIEENRGSGRYGSCGMGINETRVRYMNSSWALPWEKMKTLTAEEFRLYCGRILREYMPGRLKELNMSAGADWLPVLRDPGLVSAAFRDLEAMAAGCETVGDLSDVMREYDSAVFEAGQGLALDAENREDFPYLTPSRTTSLISARRIAALTETTDTEIIYVTRSYLTRHGAGPLPGECSMARINPAIVDLTNLPNPHQQAIRYAPFDGPRIMARIAADYEETRRILPGAKKSVLVTHLNETGGTLFGKMRLEEFASFFDNVYVSFSPFAENTEAYRRKA